MIVPNEHACEYPGCERPASEAELWPVSEIGLSNGGLRRRTHGRRFFYAWVCTHHAGDYLARMEAIDRAVTRATR